jgi:hypothetical protein
VLGGQAQEWNATSAQGPGREQSPSGSSPWRLLLVSPVWSPEMGVEPAGRPTKGSTSGTAPPAYSAAVTHCSAVERMSCQVRVPCGDRRGSGRSRPPAAARMIHAVPGRERLHITMTIRIDFSSQTSKYLELIISRRSHTAGPRCGLVGRGGRCVPWCRRRRLGDRLRWRGRCPVGGGVAVP